MYCFQNKIKCGDGVWVSEIQMKMILINEIITIGFSIPAMIRAAKTSFSKVLARSMT